MNELVRVIQHEGGWLVENAGTPIGYLAGGGAVLTPSGAQYTVFDGALLAADGRVVARYAPGASVTDCSTGVTWELRPDWRAACAPPEMVMQACCAAPYSLEDAQSTVPPRVKLLLAHQLVIGDE